MEKTAEGFKVYFLPKENYCGVTGRDIEKRLWEHRHGGKDICGCIILAVFDNRRDALDFEKDYQLKNKTKGYGYDENWRKQSSERLKKVGEEKIYPQKRKPIICIDTGQIFKGVRDCENFFNAKSGNLSKHLKGENNHKTFQKLKFKYYETKCITGID